MRDAALFADRDGTLIEFVSYLSSPDRVELLPTVPEGLRSLNDADVPVVVTTNQSGIGRGYFDRRAAASVHETMTRKLAANGAGVDDIYLCPHIPSEGCDCRKPSPGMLHEAAATHDLDLATSYVVGDRESDITAGRRVGCTTVLFPSVETDVDPASSGADHVVEAFHDVVDVVFEGRRDG